MTRQIVASGLWQGFIQRQQLDKEDSVVTKNAKEVTVVNHKAKKRTDDN